MQFSSSPAKDLDTFVVGPHQVAGRGRRICVAQQVHQRLPRKRMEVGLTHHGAVEVLTQSIQRVLPCIALIGDVIIKDTDGQALPIARAILDITSQRRRTRKPCVFGQKASDFDIRVDAFLDLPEELEDESVSINYRRICLFGAHRGDFQMGTRRLAGLPSLD